MNVVTHYMAGGRTTSLFFRLTLATLGVICGMAAFMLGTPIVQADPHAVFYTTTGQQQLFFNVLAALDQADYVEPRQFRDSLVQQRTAAQQAEAGDTSLGVTVDPIVEQTRTDFSGVLTRPITLEGDDLYTAEQAQDHAIEVARRAAVIDLVARVFGHRALGREDCSTDPNEIAKRSFGFIPDPVKWSNNVIINGMLAALLSGSQAEKDAIEAMRKNNNREYQTGRVHNEDIAQLREKAEGDTEKQSLIDEELNRAALTFDNDAVDTGVYDDITVKDGIVAFTKGPPGSGAQEELTGQALADFNAKKITQGIFKNTQFGNAALAGLAKQQTVQDTVEDQGEVADVKLLARGQRLCNTTSCTVVLDDGVKTVVEVPAAGKIAQLNALTNVLGTLDSTIRSVSPDTRNAPAGRSNLIIIPTPAPQVKGIQTGTVAGEIKFNPEDFNKAPGLGVNPIIPHREHELAHVLEALFPGFAGDPGCGCGLENAGNDFGNAMLAKVNNFVLP